MNPSPPGHPSVVEPGGRTDDDAHAALALHQRSEPTSAEGGGCSGPSDRPQQHPSGASRQLVLPADPAVVQRARRMVEDVCTRAGVAEDMCQTAVLLTSETVTNAIVHSGGGATLTVSADTGAVLVEVGDSNPTRPRVRRRDPQALGGRGLEIVQLLARRWGIRSECPGKVVWFELCDP